MGGPVNNVSGYKAGDVSTRANTTPGGGPIDLRATKTEEKDTMQSMEAAPKVTWSEWGTKIKVGVVSFFSGIAQKVTSFFSSIFHWGQEKWYGSHDSGTGDNPWRMRGDKD